MLAADRYRPLLGYSRFRRQALGGFLAQLSQGGAALALILLIQRTRGSLGLAGMATAGFVIGAAIARPIQGRLIETRGPRYVLLAIAIGHPPRCWRWCRWRDPGSRDWCSSACRSSPAWACRRSRRRTG